MKIYGFYFYLCMSLLAHLIVIALCFLTNISWNVNPKKKIYSSIQIDTIGLPELQKRTASKVKKPASVSFKKTKSKKQVKVQKTKLKKKQLKKTKGNRLSKGTKGGQATQEQMADINIYLTRIIGKIKLNWNLPKYLSHKNYFTQLEIKINTKGEIVYKQVIRSSANDIFDSRVLKALENSAPFPPPPRSVQKLISDGIVIGLSSKD